VSDIVFLNKVTYMLINAYAQSPYEHTFGTRILGIECLLAKTIAFAFPCDLPL
jgi:hypothetical protein